MDVSAQEEISDEDRLYGIGLSSGFEEGTVGRIRSDPQRSGGDRIYESWEIIEKKIDHRSIESWNGIFSD